MFFSQTFLLSLKNSNLFFYLKSAEKDVKFFMRNFASVNSC